MTEQVQMRVRSSDDGQVVIEIPVPALGIRVDDDGTIVTLTLEPDQARSLVNGLGSAIKFLSAPQWEP